MFLPNLKHLRYLIALYQEQNFHRAASACFVSQSTLSSAILKLEEQLNCQLIERDNKSFIFTTQGIEVVEKSRQLLVSANELVSFAKQQGSEYTGTVRIGCIPTIAPFLLTDFVRACQSKLPDLALFLREDTTENLMKMLSNGEIDLLILALPIAVNNFHCRLVGKDRFFMAGNKRLVETFQQTDSYKHLPEQSIFLLSSEHCLTEHALSACKLADKSRIHSFSASSLSTLVQMTAFHQGFTFLPEMAVKKNIGENEGLTIAPLDQDYYREIGVLWRKTSMRNVLYNQLSAVITDLLI
ncbi:LysR family transcriptional regulator [Colwellia sp. BRX8-7]|uniref:hydrogen peroxide-inducible genes activator n=1 Tax=Colwellia sp. BRX8-7 TaxID=2759833 RepID=UPI0015F5FE99|nr:hydrogen peroxide-inducible genes activator [Colwellia sp. BRX8-7]MBA6337297.1 LysR family transcriptional regulator [Colwellia sp. BRX8-7]